MEENLSILEEAKNLVDEVDGVDTAFENMPDFFKERERKARIERFARNGINLTGNVDDDKVESEDLAKSDEKPLTDAVKEIDDLNAESIKETGKDIETRLNTLEEMVKSHSADNEDKEELLTEMKLKVEEEKENHPVELTKEDLQSDKEYVFDADKKAIEDAEVVADSIKKNPYLEYLKEESTQETANNMNVAFDKDKALEEFKNKAANKKEELNKIGEETVEKLRNIRTEFHNKVQPTVDTLRDINENNTKSKVLDDNELVKVPKEALEQLINIAGNAEKLFNIIKKELEALENVE